MRDATFDTSKVPNCFAGKKKLSPRYWIAFKSPHALTHAPPLHVSPAPAMGQQQSSMMPAGVVGWNLFRDGEPVDNGFGMRGACANEAVGFGNASLPTGAQVLMPVPVFNEFKAKMMELCASYKVFQTKFLGMLLVIPMVVGFVFMGTVDSEVPWPLIFVSFLALPAVFWKGSVCRHNEQVDHQIRAYLPHINSTLAGKGSVTLFTLHVGLLKPKHATPRREIHLGPAPGMVVHIVDPGLPGYDPQTAGQPGYYPQSAQVQPIQYPQPAQGQPGYYPNVNSPGMNATAPAGAYAGDVEAGGKEIFIAIVPKGVDGGVDFRVTSPNGRVVTVTAPVGARQGLEFQVYA